MRSERLFIDSVSVTDAGGEIGMTLCPGRKPFWAAGACYRNLDEDLRVILNWGTKALVSLIEDHEFRAVQVVDLPRKTTSMGIEWYHLPIQDMGVPGATFEEAWIKIGSRLRELLKARQRIVLHCMGGLGRTGTIAARLLIESGIDPVGAIRQVRAAHPGAIQTIEQERYVRRCRRIQGD